MKIYQHTLKSMLSKKVQIFKNNKVSECFSLADFFMPTQKFFEEISHLSDGEKLIKIYENITKTSVNKEVKSRILSIASCKSS